MIRLGGGLPLLPPLPPLPPARVANGDGDGGGPGAARALTAGSAGADGAGAAGPAFANLLAEALGEVEQAQQGAARAAVDLTAGRIQDVSQVMIASEKATLTLELFLEVRNKVLEAYQEFMRMPL